MPDEITAFCPTCPAPEAVTRTLHALGFRLTFHMQAETSQEGQCLAPLPAQFHYADDVGTEVVYLAGEDRPSLGDGDELDLCALGSPEHESRFWLFAGASTFATQRTLRTLQMQYRLTWLDGIPAQVEAA